MRETTKREMEYYYDFESIGILPSGPVYGKVIASSPLFAAEKAIRDYYHNQVSISDKYRVLFASPYTVYVFNTLTGRTLAFSVDLEETNDVLSTCKFLGGGREKK
jgi:hypothetical protein